MRWFALVVVACTPLPPAIPGGARAELADDGGHLLVDAQVDGVPLTFVVDTAASITSLTSDGARRLHVTGTGTTRVRDRVVPTARLGSLVVGGEGHANLRVAIVDLPETRQLSTDVHGILGLDVLAQHDIVVDRARGTLAIHPTGALARNPATAAMTRVPLDHGANGLILLDVEIGGHPVRAVLDLAAPISYLNGAAGAQIGMRSWLIRPPAIRVGDVEVYPTLAFVQNLAVFTRAGIADRPAILLGADIFAKRQLAIAYTDRVAFVSR